ncbi:hypothetical protein BBOV_II004065 [Babesia bovis T2Bo]|uniref:hypothetical protein n=1 Tax=Babesia bovis T2Bo TaxID=484906 RepID=UPI001C34D067|nr:hypothetical protein BBOV_II004065 [Babesia bovis T2Bo]KAG6440147.1 hypothetical protein BBOV_II004065 [Babesia bovis T2Bo]
MSASNLSISPELKQAISDCKFRMGPEVELDPKKFESKKLLVDKLRGTNRTEILENALDTLERTKALKNKFSLVD